MAGRQPPHVYEMDPGDPGWPDEMVRLHYRTTQRFVGGQLKRYEQPFLQEIVQECWVTILRYRRGFIRRDWAACTTPEEWSRRFGSILHRITHDRVYDHRRRRRLGKKGVSAADVCILDGHPSDVLDGEAILLRSESQERVRRAIESLPDRDRRLIELSYFGGMGHAAIGRALSIRPEQVKVAKFRAHAKLRRLLEGGASGAAG